MKRATCLTKADKVKYLTELSPFFNLQFLPLTLYNRTRAPSCGALFLYLVESRFLQKISYTLMTGHLFPVVTRYKHGSMDFSVILQDFLNLDKAFGSANMNRRNFQI